jgi:hypothetical protein
MIESSKLVRNNIVFDKSFAKPLFDYLISLGILQSSIVNTFDIAVGNLQVIVYWPYFFLSVYMAKKVPLKGVVGSLCCIVICSVLGALISAYGRRFV